MKIELYLAPSFPFLPDYNTAYTQQLILKNKHVIVLLSLIIFSHCIASKPKPLPWFTRSHMNQLPVYPLPFSLPSLLPPMLPKFVEPLSTFGVFTVGTRSFALPTYL